MRRRTNLRLRHFEDLESRVALTVDFIGTGQEIGDPSFGTHDIVLADLDGDGDLDAWVSGLEYTSRGDFYGQVEGSAYSQIWLNDGNARFTRHGERIAISRVHAASVGDVDSDGDLDVLANAIWLNNGDGVFTLGSTEPTSGILSDLDGDGDLDIYGQSRVWINGGDGVFVKGANHRRSETAHLADFDGDNDLDALSLASDPNGGRLLFNGGDATFERSNRVPSQGLRGSQLGDLDGDGDVDAWIRTGFLENRYDAWLNDGFGWFEKVGRTELQFNSSITDSVLGDFDNDGDLDAILAVNPNSVGSNGMTAQNLLFLNDGHGAFEDSGLRIGDSASTAVAVGDLDGDGDLDMFVGNAPSKIVTQSPPRKLDGSDRVWINESLSPAESDLDGDGQIGFLDFLILSSNFGTSDADGDINGDKVVSFADFLILSFHYGQVVTRT